MLDVLELGHTYGAGATAHKAIEEVSFRVEEGEIVCIVGPSGCGKSTLLRTISGLIKPSSGEVKLHDKTSPAPPATWPWCSRTTGARCSRG